MKNLYTKIIKYWNAIIIFMSLCAVFSIIIPTQFAHADVTAWTCSPDAIITTQTDCIATATSTTFTTPDPAYASSTEGDSTSTPVYTENDGFNYNDTVLAFGVIVFLLMFNPIIFIAQIFRPRDKIINYKK